MQRVQKQFTQIQLQSKQLNYQVKQIDSPLHWSIIFHGPKQSPFEGGRFKVDVKFPSQYPFRFPFVKFITPIYHPGVDNDRDVGKICEDSIGVKEWKPNHKFKEVIHKLINFLASPEHVEDPVNNQAQLDVNNGTFFEKARAHTQKYAMEKQ